MAATPKRPIRKKPVKKIAKSTNGCFVITMLLVTLVAFSMVAAFYFLFLRTGPTVPPVPVAPTTVPTASLPTVPKPKKEGTTPTKPAATEATPGQGAVPTTTVPAGPSATTPPTRSGPRLAIIIDDIGNTLPVAEGIIALDLPLTFSILPHTPHGTQLAMMAKARGREILLHLPMEASDRKWSPGPGALLLSMSKEEMTATIDHDLDTPYRPDGINNHMGSRFTEDPVAMRVFLNAIRPKGLFFIDSLTSISSVGYTLARDLGVKTAKRDVFLDNQQDRTKILAQIGKVIALAKRRGTAIAICHPYPATLEALTAARARLTQEVTVVPVHELVE